jgi:DNA-binding GntR family transcriptional regulator
MTVTPLTTTELENLYAVRLQLEPWAAGLATERATNEDLLQVTQLLAETYHAVASEALRRDRAFHRAVYSAAKNEVLTKSLGQLWMQTDRYRFILLRDHRDDQAAAAEHVEIVAALQKRDSKLASSLTRNHIERVLALITKVISD